MQVSANGMPDTVRLRPAAECSWMVIPAPVAVNSVGTVSGVDGSERVTAAGWVGMGTLKETAGSCPVVAGVAPRASTVAVVEPMRLGLIANATVARAAGTVTTVW